MMIIPGRTLSAFMLAVMVLALSSCTAEEEYKPKPMMEILQTGSNVDRLTVQPRKDAAIDVSLDLVIKRSVLDWFNHTDRYISDDYDMALPPAWRDRLSVKIIWKPDHGKAEVEGTTITYHPNKALVGKGDMFESDDFIGYKIELKTPHGGAITTGDDPELLRIFVDPPKESDSDIGSDDTADEPTAPYANCADARAHGDTPITRGEPGYGPHLDRDNDGIGCELG